MNDQADLIIKALNLAPLPLEGGFFSEIYRSETMIAPGECCGTSIYYLLHGNGISDWHMVSKDEIWYYHAGCPAMQMLIFPDGSCKNLTIGPDVVNGHSPQSVIPAGTWQSAKLTSRGSSDWGLFGAAVFPGFEFKDYHASDAEKLSAIFPKSAGLIREFSR